MTIEQLIQKLRSSKVSKDILAKIRTTYPDLYLAYWIWLRHKNNYNIEIIVDGAKGVGKSFYVYCVLESFYQLVGKNKEIIKKSFIAPAPINILEEHSEFDFIKVQIEEALNNDDVRLIVFDEAGDYLLSYDLMKKESKQFVKILRKIRKYQKSFIFIHPHISEINRAVRSRSFNLWVHGLKRTKDYSYFVVLRGMNPKVEFEYSFDHIKYALFRYGEGGWFKNKYYLYSFKFKFDHEKYENYKNLFKEKQKEVENKIKISKSKLIEPKPYYD